MNDDFRRSVLVESMKVRRAPVMVISTLLMLLGPTALAVAAVLALRTSGSSSFAQKARIMVHGSGWSGYLGTGAEVMAVAMLLGLGFGYAWCFGREFAEGTVGGLFALPVSRARTAAAKCVVLLCWGILVAVGSTALLVLVGFAIGGMGEERPMWWFPLGVSLLTVANTFPITWVATVARGYLGAVGGLLGLVIVTQLVTAFGGGGWFPWAIPSLWAGLGGTGVDIHGVQLALPVLVGVVSVLATTAAWSRLELGKS